MATDMQRRAELVRLIHSEAELAAVADIGADEDSAQRHAENVWLYASELRARMRRASLPAAGAGH